MRTHASIAVTALVLTACGSTSERPRGIASVLQGQPRVITAPGARWEVRSQALRALDSGHVLAEPALQLISGAPGRRLVYRMQNARRRFACRLIGETFTRTLTPDGDAYTPVVAGTRWAAATVERIPGGLRGYEMTLLVGDVRTGRVLHRLRVARADNFPDSGDVAISPRGDVAVGWFRPRPERDGIVYGPDAVVSVLEAGQRSLSPAQVLTRDAAVGGFESYYGSVMAYGPDGDLAVVEQDSDTRLRVRSAQGTLSAPRRVTGRVRTLWPPVVTPAGRVILAWSSGRGQAAVGVARLSGGPVTRPQRLRTSGRLPDGRIAAIAQASNTVAWATKTRTWTADVGADGRLGSPHPLPGALRALAAAPDGRVLLVTAEGRRRPLRAHLRPTSASEFEAPAPIAGTANAFDVFAEFAPRTGTPLLSVQHGTSSERQALTTATRR